VIYRFTGLDGNPSGGLVLGPGPSLYGVAQAENGNVYSLPPPSAAGGVWIQSTVYSFPALSSPRRAHRQILLRSAGTLEGAAICCSARLLVTEFDHENRLRAKGDQTCSRCG
jgi:hypothetical protein